jgi:NAD(P)-dependent dehydrogenase (short-subunit alcohol dehydrogenase family)
LQDLAGKVAVVTGGASGIGLAMAQRFAEAGMNIVLGDIEAEPLAMAEASIAAKGAKVLAHRTDVAKPEDIEALAVAAYARFGNVHVLCNNAGVGGSRGTAWELSLDDWRWVIDVDLWSVINGVRSFVPRMIASGEEAHVVNTASVAGLLSGAVGAPYTVAKFGVVALTENLYFELKRAGHKIGASVLCPGFVATNIFDSGRNRQADYGEGRKLTPQEEQVIAQLRTTRQAGIMQPDYIAEQVFSAVMNDQLYVIVPGNETLDGAIKARHDRILNRENPEVNFALA